MNRKIIFITMILIGAIMAKIVFAFTTISQVGTETNFNTNLTNITEGDGTVRTGVGGGVVQANEVTYSNHAYMKTLVANNNYTMTTNVTNYSAPATQYMQIIVTPANVTPANNAAWGPIQQGGFWFESGGSNMAIIYHNAAGTEYYCNANNTWTTDWASRLVAFTGWRVVSVIKNDTAFNFTVWNAAKRIFCTILSSGVYNGTNASNFWLGDSNTEYQSGNLNFTNFVVTDNAPATVTNTCTYTSGNWNINIADKCNITAATNVSGNVNIYGNATAGYTIFSSLNFSKFYVYPNATGKILLNKGSVFKSWKS